MFIFLMYQRSDMALMICIMYNILYIVFLIPNIWHHTVCKAVFFTFQLEYFTHGYILLHNQRLWWLWQISGVVFWKYYSHHTLPGPGHILVTPRTVAALSWAFRRREYLIKSRSNKSLLSLCFDTSDISFSMRRIM